MTHRGVQCVPKRGLVLWSKMMSPESRDVTVRREDQAHGILTLSEAREWQQEAASSKRAWREGHVRYFT